MLALRVPRRITVCTVVARHADRVRAIPGPVGLDAFECNRCGEMSSGLDTQGPIGPLPSLRNAFVSIIVAAMIEREALNRAKMMRKGAPVVPPRGLAVLRNNALSNYLILKDFGAGDAIRTRDPNLGKVMLYP